ncbi:MAG: hypothetical protein M5U34_01360 [Chloroflexi bacterium]|nr:hypothetical protein [Chloroflexota bacterium]
MGQRQCGWLSDPRRGNNDSWKSEIDTALGLYLAGGNAADLQTALTAAAGGADQTMIEAAPEEANTDVSGPVVFSWWTGGGEAAGLEAMIEVFAECTPMWNSSMPL